MNKRLFLIGFSIFYLFFTGLVNAQTPVTSPTPPETIETDEVVKIDSSLIQTSVTVLDKNGKFITGLSKDDFEVKVDNKSIKVEHFDAITKTQKTTNKNGKGSANTLSNEAITLSSNIGRNIVFYVDDFNLSPEGTKRVYDLLSNFIRNEMNSNDQVLIVSPSGRIGFLQQFSNDRLMLLAALEKIKFFYSRASIVDVDMLPMTAYEALLIDRNDTQIIDIFYEEALRKKLTDGSKDSFVSQLRSKARQLLAQKRRFTEGSLQGLSHTLNYSQKIPGRKLVFYLSDGFLLDQMNTNTPDILRRVTNSALRSNSVINSIDIKGLTAGMPEGTTSQSLTGVGFRVQSGERHELLDGLFNVAETTGGKLFTNNNDLQIQMQQAIDESSGYYLLAWEPDEEQINNSFRTIDVSVRNRPNLTVRFQKGYMAELEAKSNDDSSKNNRASINPTNTNSIDSSLYLPISSTSLPIYLLLDTAQLSENEFTVNAGIQLTNSFFEHSTYNSSEKPEVKMKLVVYDEKGKEYASFEQNGATELEFLKSSDKDQIVLTNNVIMKPPPGIYQIRAAVQDIKSGKVGNVSKWIIVPDLKSDTPSLSTIILFNVAENGELVRNAQARYPKNSSLRFYISIYKSSKSKAIFSKDIMSVRTRIYQQNKVISDITWKPIENNDGSLFSGIDLSIKEFNPGKYEIEMDVTNTKTKKTSTRWASFEVY